jgi:hypothetical protein
MKGNTMEKKWQIMYVGDGPTKPTIADENFVSIFTVAEEGGVKFAAVYEEEAARLLVEAPEMYDLLNNLRYCLGKELLKDTMGYDFARRLCAVLQRVEGRNDETP